MVNLETFSLQSIMYLHVEYKKEIQSRKKTLLVSSWSHLSQFYVTFHNKIVPFFSLQYSQVLTMFLKFCFLYVEHIQGT